MFTSDITIMILVGFGMPIIGTLFGIGMLIRNTWVYKNRIALNSVDGDLHDRLPSYGVMMRKWWIWDVTKFIDMDLGDNDPEVVKQRKIDALGKQIVDRYHNRTK